MLYDLSAFSPAEGTSFLSWGHGQSFINQTPFCPEERGLKATIFQQSISSRLSVRVSFQEFRASVIDTNNLSLKIALNSS
ncbi:hypothetical protein Tco_1094747 [Tanacetum coccineum]|uniref:Uncharacterized protein n=1 Tax=Tanacetum coccineum TaxID=301880 RepID=A0ABQ5IHS2_9ASTR